jgi:hypothetical protein
MRYLLMMSFIMFLSSGSYAQTKCTTDYFGNTTCTGSDGTTMRGSTDYFGNETWRDNRGNTVRGTTDYFGNKTYRDNSGNTDAWNHRLFWK